MLVACAPASGPSPDPAPATDATTTALTPTPGATPTPSPSASPTPSPEPAAPFDAASAYRTVEHLAGLGPREATGPAFDEAATWVADQLRSLGHIVTEQSFDVPAGDSWGVDVPAGASRNVIADTEGLDPLEPHLVIGAHLDTVPQSPGAEDNASGVAVLLELARMLSEEPVDLPVRMIAFGAEEPRGEGDDRHHYGSQHYVAELDQASRDAIVAMVALDRVGVPGPAVPVGAGGPNGTVVREQLVAAAGDIPTEVDEPNRSSDHWSFEKGGIPAARLGSISFSGYHSPNDVPGVIDEDQLDAVGRITWNWLRSHPAEG